MSVNFEKVKNLPLIESKLVSSESEYIDFEIIPNQCKFSDNYWNLISLKLEQYKSDFYKYDFSGLDRNYIHYLKYLVLRELFIKRNKVSTVKSKFLNAKRFIQYLQSNRIFYLNLIDVEILSDYIVSINNRENERQKHRIAIKDLLGEFEIKHNELDYRAEYDFLDKKDHHKYKMEKENGKNDFIPKQFHSNIVSLALKDLISDELTIDEKKVSAMIIIIAETGMRIGEFRILQVNQLDSLSFDEDVEKFFYLNFKSYKTRETLEWTKTFLTENAQVAYQFLNDILADFRGESKYLYVNKRFQSVYSKESTLMNQLQKFFYRHSEYLGKIANSLPLEERNKLISWEITKTYTGKHYLRYLKEEDIGKVIYRVNFHQFRVTLATILYDKGYHLDWIREHMNHMSTEMTEHYIRIDELKKQNKNVVETLLKRANSDGTALETSNELVNDKYVKEELNDKEFVEAYDKINKFLKKKKFNIYKDMSQIIKVLARTDTSIMDMELGICAKSLNKLCQRHEYISSIQDAYFIGVQIPSIEELEYSYKRFADKVKIIEHNEKLYKKNPRYRNELEREFKGLKLYIEKKVAPELEMLSKEIEDKGKEAVLNSHPDLLSIVKHIQKIKQEVLVWKQKTLNIS
jgi:integrase